MTPKMLPLHTFYIYFHRRPYFLKHNDTVDACVPSEHYFFTVKDNKNN